MKIELETSDIERIVEKVVERLTPLLKHNSNSSYNDILTVDELADYIKVKTSWIYEIHKREIPFQKAGKFSRFRKKDIDLWLLNPYHHDLDNYNLNHNGRG
ncbi:MAG: helix-turn-helix domain-containing protein [Planctomycetota bacterium]|jgi:excisionase family DNA binding protein